MNVLLINPWAVVNDEHYASGFVSGMNKYAKLDFATNFYYKGTEPNGKMYRIFFKISQNMPVLKIRKIIRGLEYIVAWGKILRIIREKEYDIIHIHWLLMYKTDLFFLKKIKRICKNKSKLVLTAHNVLPHISGEEKVDILSEIYGLFDVILLHGKSIVDEFANYFPQYVNKVKIQYHGEYFNQNTEFLVIGEEKYKKILSVKGKVEKIFIMFGGHFYNKGTDRIISVWSSMKHCTESALIVLGSIDSRYIELKEKIRNLKDDSILFFEGFADDNFLNFCINVSDCILIPYRHASMSGIVFTAASFKKTVISTKCGVIADYLENGVDSIVCENSETGLADSITAVENLEKAHLQMMGEKLSENIKQKYNWDLIVKKLYDQVYNQ